MKRALRGLLVALLLLGGGAYAVWRFAPDTLPEALRRDNPRARDYAPVIYRWTDAEGVVQLTDRPPPDRPYEEVRIDPDRNIVPNLGEPRP